VDRLTLIGNPAHRDAVARIAIARVDTVLDELEKIVDERLDAYERRHARLYSSPRAATVPMLNSEPSIPRRIPN